MKKFLRLFTIVFVFVSCNSIADNQSNTKTPVKVVQTGKKFFDYDKIDYYYHDSPIDLKEIHNNQSRSEIDSIKAGIILNYIPTDLSDTFFINKLDKFGFKKYSIDKSMFSAIDGIFSEKPKGLIVTMPCIHTYYDLLIFKKNEKIIGTAKVELGCWAYQIHGSSANIESFGQEKDYENLKKILRASSNKKEVE